MDFDKDGKAEYCSATTTVSEPVGVDRIKLTYVNMKLFKAYLLNIYGYDPPGPNFYLVKHDVNGESKTKRLKDYQITNDELIDGQNLNGLPVAYYRHRDKESKYENWSDFEFMTFIGPGDTFPILYATSKRGSITSSSSVKAPARRATLGSAPRPQT